MKKKTELARVLEFTSERDEQVKILNYSCISLMKKMGESKYKSLV